jgi:hypothetical protein
MNLIERNPTKALELTSSLRETARQRVIDSVIEAAANEHLQNYLKLHVFRDGEVRWTEFNNRSSDIIDDQAKTFSPVPSVATVGTGSYQCNCGHCNDSGYESKAAAIDDAVGDSDLFELEQSMLERFDAIPVGYFDDENEAWEALQEVR